MQHGDYARSVNQTHTHTNTLVSYYDCFFFAHNKIVTKLCQINKPRTKSVPKISSLGLLSPSIQTCSNVCSARQKKGPAAKGCQPQKEPASSRKPQASETKTPSSHPRNGAHGVPSRLRNVRCHSSADYDISKSHNLITFRSIEGTPRERVASTEGDRERERARARTQPPLTLALALFLLSHLCRVPSSAA